jgi:hypothetical protein
MEAEPAISGGFPNIIGFANGADNWTWSYKLSTWQQLLFYPLRNTKPCIFNGQGNTIVGGDGTMPSGLIVTTPDAGAFAPQYDQDIYQCGTQVWRLELQVDAARTPKVVARIYPVDSPTVSATRTLTANPTSVAMDRIYIGDCNSSGYCPILYLGNIEVHDDYNLGGQYTHSSDAGTTPASASASGTPFKRPKYETFRLDRALGVLEPIELIGRVDRTAGIIDTADAGMKFDDMDYRYEKPVDFTEYHWFIDGTDTDNSLEWRPGSGGTAFGLIYPSSTPPAGGWPLVLWAHSGFFIEGTRRALDKGWLFHWLNRGYAVATVGYLRSALDLFSPYDNTAGKYPTWIIDYKRNAMWLQSKGRSEGDDTYPLDTTKMIFTGYSAGGYIALGAMASRELSDDGSGRDLRARTTSWQAGTSEVPGVPDPVPLACIVYGAPTDMQIAVDNDPTHPDWGSIMRVTAKCFSGNAQDVTYSDSMLTNTSIMNMIQRNASRIVPTMYVRGTSDYLVVADHEAALADAMSTYAPGVLYRGQPADGVVHDRLADQFNFNHVDSFLSQVGL